MVIDEIGNLVAQRLLQGSMHHEDFINYYNFLGLKGYKTFHEYHAIEEIMNYREFVDYYIGNYNKLISKFTTDSLISLSIIPDNWYNHLKENIDINTKRNAIKTGLEKYVLWERQTKKFLEDMAIEAINISAIGLSDRIKKYIKAVEEEIEIAQKEWLEIKATDYDLSVVIPKQDQLCKHYGKKIQKVRKELDYDKPQRS